MKDWKTYKSEKYGFQFKYPPQFEVNSEDKGVTLIYQPRKGAAPAAKKKGFGLPKVRLGPVDLGGGGAAGGGGGGGELDSAVSIYVNWTWMPDVGAAVQYNANKKSDQQNIDSPDPDYKDIVDFSKKKGYAYEGYTYWYKEVDKSDPEEIHRWHIKSYGNKSAYVAGLCGVYRQFEEWGPIYEKVIKTWELIPMKK
jgi:hypothetical protein